jgi:GDP/UDP-N,N'-diacetylbacillosamine 2-epimerase (hydrolysing)
MIDHYVANNHQKSVSFVSLGQLRYLSSLQYVDAVIGNSSSGLIEVPSFNIPTINIGDRQKGRLRAASIIDCKPAKADILAAYDKINSTEFKKLLVNLENPYGNGGASQKIINILSGISFDGILKKTFFDKRR